MNLGFEFFILMVGGFQFLLHQVDADISLFDIAVQRLNQLRLLVGVLVAIRVDLLQFQRQLVNRLLHVVLVALKLVDLIGVGAFLRALKIAWAGRVNGLEGVHFLLEQPDPVASSGILGFVLFQVPGELVFAQIRVGSFLTRLAGGFKAAIF